MPAAHLHGPRFQNTSAYARTSASLMPTTAAIWPYAVGPKSTLACTNACMSDLRHW